MNRHHPEGAPETLLVVKVFGHLAGSNDTAVDFDVHGFQLAFNPSVPRTTAADLDVAQRFAARVLGHLSTTLTSNPGAVVALEDVWPR